MRKKEKYLMEVCYPLYEAGTGVLRPRPGRKAV